MRILHISTRLILGGSQENTVLSCEGQARLGHEVHLAFGPIYGPEGSLLTRVEAFNKRCERGEEKTREGKPCHPIVTHVVPHLVREVSPRRDLRAAGQMRELIRTIKPDVVHTHSSKAGVLGRIAAWNEGGREGHIRVVHTIHGPPFMPVEGSALQRAKVRLNNWIYTLAERLAAKRCHTIVSVADAMTKQFQARGIGRPEQYVTVHSGMETGPYLDAAPGEDRASVRARLGLSDTDFVIGTVARLAQHKGHDDVLDALAADLKVHPEWKLLWVGDGWWRARLIAKAHAMGIATTEVPPDAHSPPLSLPHPTSHIPHPTSPLTSSPSQLLITGLVPPDRIPGLMRAMDVLVHPSYREGLPRTVPQALLAGVCPIAYDCDGTPEVVRDRETGLLVPTGDVAKLREAVLWAFEHPRERAEMAARGQAECAAKFSTERMVQELEKVYRSGKSEGGSGK
jgi:glycosyltransferase involved in cell wall biosynthesis